MALRFLGCCGKSEYDDCFVDWCCFVEHQKSLSSHLIDVGIAATLRKNYCFRIITVPASAGRRVFADHFRCIRRGAVKMEWSYLTMGCADASFSICRCCLCAG